MGRDVLRELLRKTTDIMPPKGQWRIFYLGFARAGWTDTAQEFAQEVTRNGGEGLNWHVMGMRLLDLSQVDTDLHRWTVE